MSASKDDEKEIDLPLPNTSYLENRTDDLTEDLKLLKKKYDKLYAPLIERKWISLQPKTVYQDVDQKNADERNKNIRENSIKLLQFNMLADGLSGVYFKEKNEKSFLDIDVRSLQWTYRGLRILELILSNDPDIICLQECDGLPFFAPYLKKKGYAFEFQPKTESPILSVEKDIQKDRNNPNIKLILDGVVIIYKQNKFKIKKQEIFFIDMSKNKEKVNALAVPFQFVLNNNKVVELLVISVHPKSTKTKDGEDLRVRQLKLMLNDIIKEESMKNKFILMACDLNSAPVKYIPIKKGKEVLEEAYDPSCYSYLTNDYKFLSSYRLCSGNKNIEPPFTTLKKREHGVDKSCLDYIFLKNNDNKLKYEIVGYLEIPEKDNMLLPNWFYPSDHFSLVVQISFQC